MSRNSKTPYAIKHHPKQETLALYAAGQLDEARSVVMSSHCAVCDECKTTMRDFETLGGAALESAEPVAMSDNAMSEFWDRVDNDSIITLPITNRGSRNAEFDIVRPLQRYLKGNLDQLNWNTVAPGMSQHILQAEGYRDGVLRFLKIMPGTRMPKHTHKDSEYTLIMRGAYEDEFGAFGPGDFADLDNDNTHSPMAVGNEPCICLIATNAPLKFKSLIGKISQPFIGL